MKARLLSRPGLSCSGILCSFASVLMPYALGRAGPCIYLTMRFVVRETTMTNQHREVVAVLRNPCILGGDDHQAFIPANTCDSIVLCE
jgi:hypothetical protein